MTEFAAMAAVRIERVTVRNPLDSFFPGYSSTGPTRNDAGEIGRGGAVRTTTSHVFSAGCAKNFTAFFELGAALRGACGGCCREYAQGQQAQPLTLLLAAAARNNISVVLGLAWSGSAPHDAAGLASLAALQAAVATRLYGLYGDLHSTEESATMSTGAPRTVVGAYTEVEMNNCHSDPFNQAYVGSYLAPVSAAVAAAAKARSGGDLDRPFVFADPYFEPRHASNSGCMNASAYGRFWRAAFDAAPAFTLIAPQDGVGAHNLSAATVREFFDALRKGSHSALRPRKFGALVELFEQFPLNGSDYQPTCEHRRPAPFQRILAQLKNEAPYVDDMEFTAWEFHSYMSPLPGPCSWAKDAAKRNRSDGLYQQYKRYVDAHVGNKVIT